MLSPALLFRHLGARLLVRGGRTGLGRGLFRVHRREEARADVRTLKILARFDMKTYPNAFADSRVGGVPVLDDMPELSPERPSGPPGPPGRRPLLLRDASIELGPSVTPALGCRLLDFNRLRSSMPTVLLTWL